MINISRKEEYVWNTALYIRLSQDDKDKSVSNSIINQKKLLNDFVSQIESEEFNAIDNYIDDGYTGTDFNRPAFKRMMHDVKTGRVNCIVVKDLSRFGREHIDVDNYLERIFPLMGVRFISVMQHLDSFKNPEKMNSIEIPFLNLINEEYARDISRKTKASLETKRKEGKYVYGRAPYGYIKDPEDKYHLIIDEHQAENVREVFNLYLSGKSITFILKSMKEKSKSQGHNDCWDKKKIRKMLSNKIYTGDMVQGITAKYNHKTKKRYILPEKDWIVVPNTHEAVISKDKFNAVQIQLSKTICSKSGDVQPSILAGYIKCADCGKKMVRTSATINGKTYKRFICSTYKKLGKEACASHIIGEDVLLEIILTTIKTQINSVINAESVIKKTQQEIVKAKEKLFYRNKIRHIEDEIDKIGKLKRGLYEDYKDEIITLDEYNIMKSEYEKAYLKKRNELNVQKEYLDKIKEREYSGNKCIENFKKHKNITELSREIILSLIDEIIVFRDKRIKILFKFKDEYKKMMSIIDTR